MGLLRRVRRAHNNRAAFIDPVFMQDEIAAEPALADT